MSNVIEIEAKAIISEEEYKRLIDVYGDRRSYTQTNYYIDSNDRVLKKNAMSLRVREKDETYELTLKTDLDEGKLERNVFITKDAFDQLKNGMFPNNEIRDLLIEKGTDIKSLRILTSLLTKRVDVNIEGGLLSIDENRYGGVVDYEVEFEHQSMLEAEAHLKALLESNGVEYRPNKITKVARALTLLK